MGGVDFIEVVRLVVFGAGEDRNEDRNSLWGG